jgi:hypothetical protein
MDHIILFKTMRELGFLECCTKTYEQLYKVSCTYYKTPHGNTPTIPIHRGTLQGDTLSPFLFAICMEPLLRWLSIESRGYKPKHHTELPESIHMTYDNHGYADDIGITKGTLENLQIKIKKLHLFSEYTGFELETTKCEARGALGGYGNPMSKENTRILRSQLNTIKCEDGSPIRHLPPNKSDKMMGVHINPMLDFRDHLKHVTTDVRQLAKALTKRLPSPNKKTAHRPTTQIKVPRHSLRHIYGQKTRDNRQTPQ